MIDAAIWYFLNWDSLFTRDSIPSPYHDLHAPQARALPRRPPWQCHRYLYWKILLVQTETIVLYNTIENNTNTYSQIYIYIYILIISFACIQFLSVWQLRFAIAEVMMRRWRVMVFEKPKVLDETGWYSTVDSVIENSLREIIGTKNFALINLSMSLLWDDNIW